MNYFKATVGLELHIQLLSKQKLFSQASGKWSSPPNTNVNHLDAGLPGSLPALNPHCLELASRAILGLNGQIQSRCAFDRKHYFFPDQPLGYQITQQFCPLGLGGYLDLPAKRVGIRQLQLEQDTAKSIRQIVPSHVLLDLNRAGVPLIEIISQPDIEQPQEAVDFVRQIQLLLRHLRVSDCNMEEGSMRCDVNVSVYPAGQPRLSGTRCELKNLNSFRTIRGAIQAEAARQSRVLQEGGTVRQETRAYDARAHTTLKTRDKETAPDYRFMPEPDIPAVHISQDWIQRIRASLPELPQDALDRVAREYKISHDDVLTLLNEPSALSLFEQAARRVGAKRALSWVASEVFGQLTYRSQRLQESPLTAAQLVGLLDALDRRQITSTQARQLLIQFMDGDPRSAPELIQSNGWQVIQDHEKLQQLTLHTIQKFPREVQQYQMGSHRRLNFLVGQIMKQTQGQAAPQQVSQLLREEIARTRS